MDKLSTLNPRTFVVLSIIIFIMGLGIGTMRDPSAGIRQENQENLKKVSVLSEQVKDCQNVIEKDRQALGLSADIILTSNSATGAVMNRNVSALNNAIAKIDNATIEMGKLRTEVEPIAKKCFKE